MERECGGPSPERRGIGESRGAGRRRVGGAGVVIWCRLAPLIMQAGCPARAHAPDPTACMINVAPCGLALVGGKRRSEVGAAPVGALVLSVAGTHVD